MAGAEKGDPLLFWGESLWLLIDCLGMGSLQISLFSFVLTGTMLVKLVLQIVVIVLNYIFSKFLIFAKKRKNL